MRAYTNWSKDFWIELNKKILKKNKFNVSSPVEVYKTEFLNNANLTLYRNVLGRKNLTVPSNPQNSTYVFNNNLLFSNSGDISHVFLKSDKENFSTRVKFFKKIFIFSDTFNENILEERSIKKTQPAVIWRKSPNKKLFNTVKL